MLPRHIFGAHHQAQPHAIDPLRALAHWRRHSRTQDTFPAPHSSASFRTKISQLLAAMLLCISRLIAVHGHISPSHYIKHSQLSIKSQPHTSSPHTSQPHATYNNQLTAPVPSPHTPTYHVPPSVFERQVRAADQPDRPHRPHTRYEGGEQRAHLSRPHGKRPLLGSGHGATGEAAIERVCPALLTPLPPQTNAIRTGHANNLLALWVEDSHLFSSGLDGMVKGEVWPQKKVGKA